MVGRRYYGGVVSAAVPFSLSHTATIEKEWGREMEFTAEFPTFEVVLRVAGSEVAVLAGFQGEGGMVDILIGVEDSALKEEYAKLIEQCVLAIRTAGNWKPLPRSDISPFPF